MLQKLIQRSQRSPKGVQKVRGEYLRWFPPYPSSAGARPDERALPKKNGPSKIDGSCVFWTHLERFPRPFLAPVFDMSSKGAQRLPNASKKAPKDLPKGAQRLPRDPQRSPRPPQGCPKTSPRVPKDCQGTSKGPKDFPKGPQSLPQG